MAELALLVDLFERSLLLLGLVAPAVLQNDWAVVVPSVAAHAGMRGTTMYDHLKR